MRMEKTIELKSIKKAEEIFSILNEFSECLESLKQGISFRKNLADKFAINAEFILGQENGENIGFIAYYANNYTEKVVYITMIAVSPAHRKKGVGKLLLEKCSTDAIERKMEFLKLEVKKDNFNARLFYEKNGFIVEREASKNSLYMKKTVRGSV